VRLTAADLAARHRDGLLPTVRDLADEARGRAGDHPWVNDPCRAQFVLWCSEHSDAAPEAEEVVEPVRGILHWCLLARYALFEDVLDSLVSHAKLDLFPTVSSRAEVAE
jgi:hypothetical protein